MNGISLPSEVLFNHACRFRLGEVKQSEEEKAIRLKWDATEFGVYLNHEKEYILDRSA